MQLCIAKYREEHLRAKRDRGDQARARTRAGPSNIDPHQKMGDTRTERDERHLSYESKTGTDGATELTYQRHLHGAILRPCQSAIRGGGAHFMEDAPVPRTCPYLSSSSQQQYQLRHQLLLAEGCN